MSEPATYKNQIAIGVAYSAAVAALYLFGYWGTFDVNILEFVGLSDLVKLAAYPLLISLASLIAGYALAEVLRSDEVLPVGGGAETTIGRFGRKNWRYLIALQVLITVLVATYGVQPWKWFSVAFLIALMFTPFTHMEFFVSLLPNPRLRGNVIFLSLFIASTAFAYGNFHAYLAKRGEAPVSVDVVRSKLSLRFEDKKPVAYLGYVGGYFVFYETVTGSVVFVRPKDENPIFLLHNSTRS
ncbi:MAG: hypothetical protein Q8L44_11580 [Sulfuritalea sp.]|nr:hypothetical protein [Sulfuritalea sp.]